jgi:cytoskeletal protein CcmA (bactofilin family)
MNQPDPSVVPGAAHLSRGVSIKGSVKFLNELLLDGEVEGTIVSIGTLTIGEQARVRGEIRTKSVNVRGTVEGNIFVTERCELQANCTVRGDIEAPRLVVNENATFLGSAKVGTGKSLPAWRSPAEPDAGQQCNRLPKVSQSVTWCSDSRLRWIRQCDRNAGAQRRFQRVVNVLAILQPFGGHFLYKARNRLQDAV